MKKINILLSFEDNWATTMGGSTPGESVRLRGKDLLHGFRDNNWMQILLYGITGRMFEESQCKLFQSIWSISTSFPEPRVWNNRVSSLAATSRSTGTLGVAAGIAVSEASIYGQGPMVWVMSFLLRAKTKIAAGKNLDQVIDEELEKYNRIYGFGRPIAESDERIVPLMEIASKLGYADGEYVQLLLKIQDKLRGGPRNLEMNVAALDAALCADQGLDVREFYYFMSLCFSAGIIFCNLDANQKNEGAFFPIRCSRILYQGHEIRQW